MECSNCKKAYIVCTQALKYRVSLHKSNIILPESRKLHEVKHFYECSKDFRIILIYQTDNRLKPT